MQSKWDAAAQQQTLQAAAIRERQAQATVKVVTQYVDRVRVVREKGDTIIKEVPVYVPVQADAACTINRGFVRMHDAAAAGDLPEPARDADAAAAGCRRRNRCRQLPDLPRKCRATKGVARVDQGDEGCR